MQTDGAIAAAACRRPIESEDACDALAVAICHATHEATGVSWRFVRSRYEVAAVGSAAFGERGSGAADGAAALLFAILPGKRRRPTFEVTVDKRRRRRVPRSARTTNSPLKFHLAEAETRTKSSGWPISWTTSNARSNLRPRWPSWGPRPSATRTAARRPKSSSITPKTRRRARCRTGSSAWPNRPQRPHRAGAHRQVRPPGRRQSGPALAVADRNKRLVAPDQFLPMLDRIAENETYMHAAREPGPPRWPRKSEARSYEITTLSENRSSAL